MKNEQKNTNIEFTKDVYMSLASNITGQIAQTKQDKEDIISKIQGRIERLKELKASIAKSKKVIQEHKRYIKNLKIEIREEKKGIRRDKRTKFSLTRQLIANKNRCIELNTLFVNDEPTIDVERFCPTKKQKAR